MNYVVLTALVLTVVLGLAAAFMMSKGAGDTAAPDLKKMINTAANFAYANIFFGALGLGAAVYTSYVSGVFNNNRTRR